jgi:ribosomal protein L11 methyltransferase
LRLEFDILSVPMFSLRLQCPFELREELIAQLWEAGTQGITESDWALEAFFDDSQDAYALMEHFAGFAPELVSSGDSIDWEQRTRDAWPPLEIGERFFLVPPWNEDDTPDGRLRLVVNPGMACGTGDHPCTQMCLEALERYVEPGMSVLDVGCGSGILSEAARLLGAARIVSCDIDADAVAVARDSVANPVFVGSVDAVRSGSFDLVIANISATVAEEYWPEFCRVARVRILSGFFEADLPAEPYEKLDREGWACWVFRE